MILALNDDTYPKGGWKGQFGRRLTGGSHWKAQTHHSTEESVTIGKSGIGKEFYASFSWTTIVIHLQDSFGKREGIWNAPGHREEEGGGQDKMEEGNYSAHPLTSITFSVGER